jgi:hypothetical protein
MNMLIVYLGDPCKFQFSSYPTPTLVLHNTISTISATSKMVETDNFKEGGILLSSA